jgi:hypothetical protein
MAFLTGYAAVSHRALTGAIPTIAWSHPMAQGLVGAYYPGVFPTVPIINLASPGNGDMTSQGGTATPIVMTPEGPGINVAGTGTGTRFVQGNAPTQMLLTSKLSLFVRGQWGPGATGANAPQRIFGISYDVGGASPFDYFVITSSDGTQQNCIGCAWASSSSVFTNGNFTGTRTLVSGQMVSAAALMIGSPTSSQHQFVMQNGVVYTQTITSNAGFFGASPQIGFGGNNSSRNASFIPTVAYAWNRTLPTSDLEYIAYNPYSLLRWPVDIVYEVLSKPTGAPQPPAVNTTNRATLLSPLTVGGAAMEWLGRRKMTMKRLRGE